MRRFANLCHNRLRHTGGMETRFSIAQPGGVNSYVETIFGGDTPEAPAS
jgi:hypothetical protein